jgi:succinyl-CoA synthetase beta subunit
LCVPLAHFEQGTPKILVKSQVLAGGRGKGSFMFSGLQGGVHIVDSPAKVKDLAAQMLGDRLITKQTGAKGARVSRVR